MAHALRYYKEIQQDNGQIIRLEIHKKDSALPAVEIGRVLQALRLDIQGGADTIDAPIVKTSLTMTFVDAPDLEEGKKCGNWEEFYTPDSTMWMVVLKADGKTIWGGYVTPDSYQEDLRYRGSVTIIARDNIGHMQDFPFDMEGNADGMVTLEQLVNEAWAKIESPMRLDWWHEEQEAMYLMCEGNDAPSTYMNVSAFEDMNYFDAVEKALYSYGLVMRYTGSNLVTIMSLRDMPYQGKSGAPRAIEPIFLAHAQRELAPAVRRIEEAVKYEFTDGIQIPLAKNVTFSGVAYTVPFYSTNVFGETTTKSIPVHAIANTDGEGWSNVPSSTLFFNPKKYTIRQTALAEDAERMLFLACNTDGSHSAIYRKTVVCADFRINMTFGRPVERDSYGGVGYCYGFSDSDDREQNGIGSLSARSVDCYISREQNGIQQFFDGHSWSADAVLLTIEVTDRQCGIDVPLGDSSGTAEVTLAIVDVRLNDKWDFSDGLGLYIPISSMYWGVAETASLCETNNVNTVYVDTNNVILEHSPELAPALDEVPFPSVIKNGIFVKSGNAYLPAKGWAWSGGTPQQMAVYNHLQLLCYHSKPNNIISGDIVNADFVDMEAIYEWGGANHLLVSGSYNFLNGRIESAVLREFKFYNEMWSDVAGAEVPETEQNNRTTAESGSGASKALTYSNETTVNIGGTGGGGTGGSSTLAGLLDVQVSSPSNGQALVYDSVSGMWMNKTIEKGNDITSQAIISALGYTPLNADQFTKANLGLGNVDNIAANKYFTALSSGTANAVSMTIGGVTKNITAAALKTSLGLAGLAYQASVQAALGYTPFDSAAFTKANIKNALGIKDWALAASKPSYTWTEIGSRPTALSAFTNDLGLGSLAYKSSLVASDIPSLPWSKITSGKPTTLSGYGITDAILYEGAIDLSSAYRSMGYGHASKGWKTSGPAAVFGTALYNLRMQCAIGTTDTPYVYVSQMYNGEAKGWAELVTYEGAKGRVFYAGQYWIGDTAVLHRSDNDTFLNYGNRTTGDLYLYGKNLRFSIDGGSSHSLKILNDGSLLIHDIALTKGTSNSLKAGAYEALNYFADGKLIMHRNAGAENFFLNYGGAAERMYLYGSVYGFHIGASRERAFTIDENKDASFAANLTVAGNMYSKNYPAGEALSQDPTSAFISTIFDADAVSDSSYRMKILRSGSAYDRFNAAYSPIVAFKTGDTHGFVSFGYNAAGKAHCYIGGGSADKINWSGKLFHDNMDLLPKDDNTFVLGDSSHRWSNVNSVNINAYGNIVLSGQLLGTTPAGGTYPRVRFFSDASYYWMQIGSYDGLSAEGSMTICGMYGAGLKTLRLIASNTIIGGASQFVSLATFNAGLKIGDATLTWDATAGMLKIDKGVYSEGAITAKKKA